MKKFIISAIIVSATVASCSTVSSIMQNTFPYNANFLVASGSSAETELVSVSPGLSVNQVLGANSNVKDVRVSNATLSVPNGSQGVGILKSVKLYISSNGANETLVASRDNIPDNLGNSLTLDINNSSTLDNIMKSGGVQQRLVYVLKSSPTADVTFRSSIGFSSVPAN